MTGSFDYDAKSPTCTCGRTFRIAEDFNDHLPCPGTKEQWRVKELETENAGLRKQVGDLQDIILEIRGLAEKNIEKIERIQATVEKLERLAGGR